MHGERGKPDGKTAHEPFVLPLGDAVDDRAHVRRRPAHVEREGVRVSGEGGDARRADDSGGRPGEKGERGMGCGLLERRDSARGAHHLRGRELRFGARARKGSEVAGQDRPQVRVDRRRRCALVLAELRRDLVRGDDVQRRIAATDLVRDGLLGAGIAEGEQQAHRHRLRVQLGKRRQVERDELALTARPLADSVAALERDERRWVLGARPIEVRPRLAAEVQEVLEALVRHERRARAASLQERVRGDRRAVREAVDPRCTYRPRCSDDRLLLPPRRRDLRDAELAVGHEDRVGEGPADVDAQDTHAGIRARTPRRVRPQWTDSSASA